MIPTTEVQLIINMYLNIPTVYPLVHLLQLSELISPYLVKSNQSPPRCLHGEPLFAHPYIVSLMTLLVWHSTDMEQIWQWRQLL